MKQDMFLISAEAELKRFSSLMNRSSKVFWKLKDMTTEYARQVWFCYYSNKMNYDRTLETIKEYRSGKEVQK